MVSDCQSSQYQPRSKGTHIAKRRISLTQTQKSRVYTFRQKAIVTTQNMINDCPHQIPVFTSILLKRLMRFNNKLFYSMTIRQCKPFRQSDRPALNVRSDNIFRGVEFYFLELISRSCARGLTRRLQLITERRCKLLNFFAAQSPKLYKINTLRITRRHAIRAVSM